MIFGGYFYIQSLRAEIELAREVQAKMETVISKQSLAMENMKADIERMNKIQSELSSQVRAAEQSSRDLAKKFTHDSSGKERNFGALTNAKPNIVEQKVNKGTRDALRCNEIVTGSPLTANELNGKVKNSICPDLFPKLEKK